MAAGVLCAQGAEEKVHRHKKLPGKAADQLITGTGPAYAGRPEAMALADDIAARYELDRKWVRQAIGTARYMPQVVQLIAPPRVTTPKNWQLYRSRFIDPERIQAGVAFWRAHQDTLERATLTYGVPGEIIVGILGVETYFGRRMGNYRVLDALATLAFDFPQSHPRARERSAFFRAELGELLNLRNQEGIDPLQLRGSYAGAMGLPQFMPSSWAHYAVDFDGDGRVDLFNSTADAIGSVANYFKTFNWQPGMPTHYEVDFDHDRLDLPALLAPDILPTFSVDSFTTKGAVLDPAGQQHPGPLALVELRNGEGSPSYVAGTENFYAVTRYNWSSYYALAVIQFGHAVAAALPLLRPGLEATTTVSETGACASTRTATSDVPACE